MAGGHLNRGKSCQTRQGGPKNFRQVIEVERASRNAKPGGLFVRSATSFCIGVGPLPV